MSIITMPADKWWSELNNMPQLTSLQPNEHGVREWLHEVHTTNIRGVELGDEATPCEVGLARVANDEPEFSEPHLGYRVEVFLGENRHMLTATPASAIVLGQALLLAGAAAQRDLARNAQFLESGSEATR